MGEVVQGAVDVLEAEEYGLLLFTCNRGEDSMRQFAAQVAAKSFDGLLVIEPEGTLDYIATLHSRGLPMVLIDDRDQMSGQIPSVGTTNHTGAGAAARPALVWRTSASWRRLAKISVAISFSARSAGSDRITRSSSLWMPPSSECRRLR